MGRYTNSHPRGSHGCFKVSWVQGLCSFVCTKKYIYIYNVYNYHICIYIYMPANVGIPMYLGIFLSFYMWHIEVSAPRTPRPIRSTLVGGAMCPSWKMKNFVNGFSDDIPYMKWKNNPNVPNHQPDIHDYTNDRYGLCMYMANIDRYTSTLACQKIARRENGGTCIKGTCIKGTCKQPDIWVYVPVMRRKHRLLTGTHIKARGFRRTEVYHVFILHMKYTIVLIYIYIILLIYLYLNIYIILYLYIYVYI